MPNENEEKLKEAVQKALKELQLTMELDPHFGDLSPDIVAEGKDGVIVIELRSADPSTQLPSGSLQQAVEYKSAVTMRYPGKKVSTLVLTNQFVPPLLAQSFTDNGVALDTITSIDSKKIKGILSKNLM